MQRTAIIIGIVLILLGLGAYFGTGMESWTALIPSIIGAVIAGCGAAARSPGIRKHAMHAAVLVAVIGVVGSLMRAVPTVLGGELNVAVSIQLVTAILLIVFVVLAVRSFIVARRSEA